MIIKFLTSILLTGIVFQTELEKLSLIDNKIEILVPKGWKPMSEDLIKIKYPGARPPKLVYSDVTGGISMAFNHTESKATQAELETYKGMLKGVMNNAYPDAEWLEDGMKEINGKKVGYYKVITNTPSGKIFNQIFFTDLEEKLLLCSFNCVESKMEKWKPTADEIMNSLTIK